MKRPALRFDQGLAVIAIGLIHYAVLIAIGSVLLGAVLFVLMSETDHLWLRARLDAVHDIWSAERGVAQAKLTQACVPASETTP